MGKNKGSTKHHKKAATEPVKSVPDSVSSYFEKNPNLLPIIVLCILLVIFFYDVLLNNQTFQPPDKLTSKSIAPFISESLARGTYPLWNPYIFGGMPSFASLQSAPYIDLLGNIIRLISLPLKWILPNPDFVRPFLKYFVFGLFMYFLMFKKTNYRMIALFCAVAMVFQPHVISFAAFGHGTKLATVALIPIIFLLLDSLLEKRQLHYFALLALAIGTQLMGAHTQMAYYCFMMIGLYLIYWVIYSKIKKIQLNHITKSIGLVLLSLLIGVLMSSWLYLSVFEYADFSIRGGGSGLDYGYATSWSFSPMEMVTFLIPSFVGFGGQTYWGDMPFTDYPLYMGIVALFLAGLCLIIRRDKYSIFFAIITVFSIIISFGQNFPILYDPLFYALPFFNKFRVPSMILILTQFSIVVLAGLGLKSVLTLEKELIIDKIRKYIYIFTGICGALFLFTLLGESTYMDWAAASAKSLAPPIQQAAYENTVSDAVKMILIVGSIAVLLLMFLKEKIKSNMFLSGMILLLIIDLWSVDFKIANPRPKADEQRYFAETQAVKYLNQQTAPFRILPIADDKRENWYMYHKIQSVLGYHAAKIKIYQQFLEQTGLNNKNRFGLSSFISKYLTVVINNGQPGLQAVPREQISPRKFLVDNAVLDMLNVKYLLSFYPFEDERFKTVVQAQPMVYENTKVLARAFFVDKIRIMADENQFYEHLLSGDFDPAQEAVLFEQPEFEIVPANENTVEIISYDIHEIKLKTSVAQPSLLVLSEVYYPAGWHAIVDGEETRIYRTNSILRSIFLKPGQHDIRFVFRPTAFKAGLGITVFTLIFIAALLFISWKKSREG